MVITADGEFVALSDLREGDRLVGPDGHPRLVSNIFTAREQLLSLHMARRTDLRVTRHCLLAMTHGEAPEHGSGQTLGVQPTEDAEYGDDGDRSSTSTTDSENTLQILSAGELLDLPKGRDRLSACTTQV